MERWHLFVIKALGKRECLENIMKIKDKIWDYEKHWFKFKIRLIFLFVGILLFGSSFLVAAIWGQDVILLCFILAILGQLFCCIAFAPILAMFPFSPF